MNGITRGQVEAAVTSIQYFQENMNDATQLKTLVVELKEKVDELKKAWNTMGSVDEIEKFNSIVRDLDMVVVPKFQIAKLKSLQITYHEVAQQCYGRRSYTK